jgi:hypothetical protein
VNADNETEYYIDHVLPFGLRSSAVLFNHFADGLEFAMCQNGVTKVLHYLDDAFYMSTDHQWTYVR